MQKCKNCKNKIQDGSIYCNWCGSRQVKSADPVLVKVPDPIQLSSGSWHIYLRKENISVTEKTRSACIKAATQKRMEYQKKATCKSELTLREACLKYIEQKSSRLSPSTIAGYTKIVNTSFLPIMDTKLRNLSESDLDAAVEKECSRISRLGKKQAPKTIWNAWLFVASVLKIYAPNIDRSNITLPEKKRSVTIILPPEDVYRAVKGSRIELACMLSMWLSLSMSEIRGLKKSRSIFGNTLVIRDTTIRVNGKDITKEGGKEEMRTRAHNIPPYIKALVDKVDGDIIVPLSPSQIEKDLTKLLKAANLERINFHKLRHINASVMASLGIREEIANERGGWKTSYTRKNVYTHIFPKDRIEADKIIDSYFGEIVSNFT